MRVQHEWDKHGTCALAFTDFGLDSQLEYFETVLELHQENSLYVSPLHCRHPGGYRFVHPRACLRRAAKRSADCQTIQRGT